MEKKIGTGPCVGLIGVDASEVQMREMEELTTSEIPTKQKPIRFGTPQPLVPDYCPNGDLDKCPAPCGACLDAPNAHLMKGVPILEVVTVLDTDAYLAEYPKLAAHLAAHPQLLRVH
jgi:hypothetical protein